MKRSLVVAVLSMFVILGLGAAGIAQQSDSSSSAQSQTQPANPSDTSSNSGSSTVEVKPAPSRDSGESVAASPRTTESRRIFGLDPTAAVLIAAALLFVVVLSLVAMTRGSAETISRTDIDLDRRL